MPDSRLSDLYTLTLIFSRALQGKPCFHKPGSEQLVCENGCDWPRPQSQEAAHPEFEQSCMAPQPSLLPFMQTVRKSIHMPFQSFPHWPWRDVYHMVRGYGRWHGTTPVGLMSSQSHKPSGIQYKLWYVTEKCRRTYEDTEEGLCVPGGLEGNRKEQPSQGDRIRQLLN